RRLREPVREADLEDVADAALDGRAGHAAVVAPGAYGLAGGVGPVELARFEVHADDRAAGVRPRGVVGALVGGSGVGRRAVGIRVVVLVSRHGASWGSWGPRPTMPVSPHLEVVGGAEEGTA